jgi:hypothetical protein
VAVGCARFAWEPRCKWLRAEGRGWLVTLYVLGLGDVLFVAHLRPVHLHRHFRRLGSHMAASRSLHVHWVRSPRVVCYRTDVRYEVQYLQVHPWANNIRGEGKSVVPCANLCTRVMGANNQDYLTSLRHHVDG